MKPEKIDAFLPASILIYREYEASLNDASVTIAITLAEVSEPVASLDEGFGSGVMMAGHILVVESTGACPPSMTWSFDGTDIKIVAVDFRISTMPSPFKTAIGAFLEHFILELDDETEAGGDGPPTVH